MKNNNNQTASPQESPTPTVIYKGQVCEIWGVMLGKYRIQIPYGELKWVSVSDVVVAP